MSYSFSIAAKDYMSSPIMKAYNNLSKLEQKANAFAGKSAQATTKAGNGFDKLSRKVNHTETELRELESQSRRTGGGLNKVVRTARDLFIGMTAIQSVKAIFNLGVEAEQTNVKFEVLLGSVSAAHTMLTELNEYANKTPYDNIGIHKNAETMLAFGIAHEKILPNMKMLGDVAMGNKNKLNGLSLVYSQIMSTGRLMGQDLLQLINQGFNPLTTIAEQTGLSMFELKKKMEQGAISATMVEEAFKIATSEGGRYYQMADKMSKTAGGLWSTLLGTLRIQLQGVGLDLANAFIPALRATIKYVERIPEFIAWLKEMKPVIYGIVGAITAYVTIMKISAAVTALQTWWTGASTAAILLSTLATSGWSTAWLALNLIMSANPIGVVILAITALVGIVIYAWNKFDWFRGGVMGVWEVLKGLGEMIKNLVVNRFKELLNGIGGIGKSLWALVNGDFSKAYDHAKEALKNLTGGDTIKQAYQDGKKAFESFGTGYKEGKESFYSDNPLEIKLPDASNKPLKIKLPGINDGEDKSSIFDDLLNGSPKGDAKNKKSKGAKTTAGNIISGGKRQTHITININKLQDKTEIHVSNTEKGINRLGEKIQEELLRAVNSVNQMQTA